MNIAVSSNPQISVQAVTDYRPGANPAVCPEIHDVFRMIASGEAELGFVPLESMESGPVIQTLDNLLLYAGKICIRDAFVYEQASDKTRFITLGQQPREATGRDVTALALYPRRDRVGILSQVTSIISSTYKLNMNSIHSRPDGKGGFIFFLDIEGHTGDDEVKACISAIRQTLSDTDITVLGSYPYLPFNEPLIKNVGIIGGTGQMGRWLNTFLSAIGYTVLIAGRRTDLSYEDCVRNSDAVIINLPIEHTLPMIERIAPLMGKGQLLLDNTGVKSRIISGMLKCTADNVEVLSIHTMFGPGTQKLAGENIITIHTEKSGPMALEFENMLFKYGARITRTSAENHDQLVTLTQGLEHILSISRLNTILSVADGETPLAPYSTPNSRLSAMIDGRIHSGDEHLYATMLKQNDQAIRTLETFNHTVDAIIRELQEGDTATFEQLMTENRRRIGDKFVDKATAKIEAMQAILKD